LEVVLHDSMRPVGPSELRFLNRHDESDGPAKTSPNVNSIELHPLGPLENCYRWAGETDVLKAIEAVVRNYAIDRERIVLCGMSMGASGTWHLGPKHPDRFVALGPYCRYVDTQDFVQTPLANFVKIGPLPAHQEKALHMLDSVGYAANACVIPAVETWTSDVRSSCPELPRLERGTFALPTASDAILLVTPKPCGSPRRTRSGQSQQRTPFQHSGVNRDNWIAGVPVPACWQATTASSFART